MVKNDEAEESVQDSLKSVVKEIVAELVAKMVKASAQKAVAGLKKRLKEKALSKLEEKLKETTEEQLEEQLSRQSRQLQKAIAEDNPSGKDYVSKLKQGFERDFDKFLSSCIGPSALVTTLVVSLCVLAVAIGGVVFCCFAKPCPTCPEPQPDLIITAITFQAEATYAEIETAIAFPSDLYTSGESWESIPSYQLTIHYVIENQGETAAGASTTCLLVNGELVDEDEVYALAAGETAERTFYHYSFSSSCLCDTYELAEIEIELRADAPNVVAESNEENNSLTIEFNPTY